MARRLSCLSAALLLLACGGPQSDPEAGRDEQLDRQPQPAPAPDLLGVELLGHGELEQAGISGYRCLLYHGMGLLMAADADGAVVRRRGRMLHLTSDTPLSQNGGGVFEEESFRIIVGRALGTRPAMADIPRPLMHARLEDRRRGAATQLSVEWDCVAEDG